MPIIYERVHDLEAWRTNGDAERAELPDASLTQEPWIFVPEAVGRVLSRPAPHRLLDVCEILVGLQTSADAVFQLKPVRQARNWVEVESQETTWRIERGILRPSLLDVQIKSYEQPVSNAYLIFPYTVAHGTAALIPARTMRDSFPGAWEYLSSHKAALAARDRGTIPRTEWYRYGRSQNLAKFDTDKVVVQVLAERPRYGYDVRNVLVTGGGNGPYYILRPRDGVDVSLLFFLGLLNHPVVEALVRSRGSDFRGAYFSRNREALKDIPIPVDLNSHAGRELHDQIVARVGRIVGLFQEPESLTPRQRTTRTRVAAAVEKEVHDLVSQAFGLNEAEVKAIQRHLAGEQEQGEE